MSISRTLRRGLAAILRPSRADRDVDDEVQHYADQLAGEFIARGMTPAAARRAAIVEIGTRTAVREHVRSAGWEHTVETVLADARFALRRLRNNPGFTIVTTLTLAISIGATTAIFSVVNPILLRPLPYPDADRMVSIADRSRNDAPQDPTFGTFAELAARTRSLSAIAVTDAWTPSITGAAESERLQARRVSANFFTLLGVPPVVGRNFDASEDVHDGPRVVILSDRLVARRFAGQSVVGRTITLDGDKYRVVGVMPHGFVDVTAPASEIWAPLQAARHADFNSREWGHHYRILGRLASGMTLERARTEMGSIAASPVGEFSRPPWADLSNGLVVLSLQRSVTANARAELLAIVSAVVVLLAIACVNVANLLLARGAQRRGELAMRVALGAGRGRILRQLLTESVILAMMGGAVGLLLAEVGVRALIALAPSDLPRIEAIHIDAWVLGFAFVVTAVVGIVVGIVPAIAASRPSLSRGLQGATRRSASGRGPLRNALVVAEVSLAFVLLVSAGLLTRSLNRLFGVKPGFDPSHVLSMQVIEAGHAYQTDTARANFFAQALDAVRRMPGVVDVAFTSQLPLSGEVDSYGYEVASQPNPKAGNTISNGAFRYAVTPDYFHAMSIPLEQGRVFNTTDRMGAPEAIIISESLARLRFGDASPIGQRMRFGPEVGSAHDWGTVVGVVGDVKQVGLGDEANAAFYVPMGQWAWVDRIQTLVVRTEGNPAALTPAIKSAVHSVDPSVPIARITTMDRVVAMTGAPRRFASILFQSFAVTALLLAAVGLYGVIAGGVAERTREIGIRAALGATSGEIVRRVVASGLGLTAAGFVFGIAGASIATRMLETLLFGVSRSDPLTYAGVIAVLSAVALLACWKPAQRAASVDPALTLRAE